MVKGHKGVANDHWGIARYQGPHSCSPRTTCITKDHKAGIILAHRHDGPGRIEQSVTCLASDVSLTADPGVASLIPARSHTFVEIDPEIFSTVFLLPSTDSFKKGCCQLQAKVCLPSTGKLLVQACPGKSVVR